MKCKNCSRETWGTIFCNKDCQIAFAVKQRVTCTCKTCGSEFIRCPSLVSKYCSTRCIQKMTGKKQFGKRNEYYQSQEVKEFKCKNCKIKHSMSPDYPFVCINCAEVVMKRDDEYSVDNFLDTKLS